MLAQRWPNVVQPMVGMFLTAQRWPNVVQPTATITNHANQVPTLAQRLHADWDIHQTSLFNCTSTFNCTSFDMCWMLFNCISIDIYNVFSIFSNYDVLCIIMEFELSCWMYRTFNCNFCLKSLCGPIWCSIIFVFCRFCICERTGTLEWWIELNLRLVYNHYHHLFNKANIIQHQMNSGFHYGYLCACVWTKR